MTDLNTELLNGVEIKESLFNIIATYKEEGVTAIRARITIDGLTTGSKFTGKEITEALLAFEVTSEKASFNKEYYDYLSDEKRSLEEIESYILNPENSRNVINHLSFYLSIGVLSRRIFSKFEVSEEVIEE